MSRKGKIILIIITIILVLAGWFVYKQWNNITAVVNSFRLTQEEIQGNIRKNKEELQKIIDEDENITVRDLTDEESKALNKGEITEEEAIIILTAKEEDQKKSENENQSSKEEKPPAQNTSDNNSGQIVSEAIAKLYIQKSIYLNKLDDVEAEVRGIYKNMSREEKKTAKKDLLAEYLPRVSAWEKECDAKVYGILEEIRTAIKQSGQDETLVEKIEEAYLNEKSLKKSYFINRYMD